MSSRVFKKLHGDNQEIDGDVSSDIEIETDYAGEKSKFNLNRYDLVIINLFERELEFFILILFRFLVASKLRK